MRQDRLPREMRDPRIMMYLEALGIGHVSKSMMSSTLRVLLRVFVSDHRVLGP